MHKRCVERIGSGDVAICDVAGPVGRQELGVNFSQLPKGNGNSMNRNQNRTVTNIVLTGLLGSAALAYGAPSNGSGTAIDPARDPLNWSNRRSERTADVPAVTSRLAREGAGDKSGPRGGCIDCPDQENEQNCAVPADTVNGGCNSTPAVFSTLRCGETLCGTGATDGTTRDTDWWRFELQMTTVVTIRITADYPVQVGIADLNNGCPIQSLLTGVFGEGCTSAEVTRTLNPGIYAAFVAPQFNQTVLCDAARYSGELICDTSAACPCPGDFNGDRVVSLSDMTLFLSSFGEEPGNLCMDFDQDGLVGLQDLSTFLPTYGLTCD